MQKEMVKKMGRNKTPRNLRRITESGLHKPNIWAQPNVEEVPEQILDSWLIVKVVKAIAHEEVFGFHLVGRDVNERNGAVSSKLINFDPRMMRGKTNSGRVYQLIGRPGTDADAAYVLSNWCQINQVEIMEATNEFLQSNGVALE